MAALDFSVSSLLLSSSWLWDSRFNCILCFCPCQLGNLWCPFLLPGLQLPFNVSLSSISLQSCPMQSWKKVPEPVSRLPSTGEGCLDFQAWLEVLTPHFSSPPQTTKPSSNLLWTLLYFPTDTALTEALIPSSLDYSNSFHVVFSLIFYSPHGSQTDCSKMKCWLFLCLKLISKYL